MHGHHRYYDISHFRAPYKNSVLAGYGQAEAPQPVFKIPTIEELQALAAQAQSSEQVKQIRAQLEQLLMQAQSSEQAQSIKNAIEQARVEEEKRIAAEAVRRAAPYALLVTAGLVVVAGAIVYHAVSR